jgi:hypothetical protein
LTMLKCRIGSRSSRRENLTNGHESQK